MKYVFLAATVFALSVVGVVSYKRYNKPSPTSENVSVVSHTVNGNITEDLKQTPEASFTLVKKTIVKKTVNRDRVLFLNSQVAFNNIQVLVQDMKRLEAQSNDPIWLLIDSPGGSVIDGATLISQMESSKAPIFTVCTRICASMAAMIHSYGVKRFSTDRALLMYHPAAGSASGQVNNMVSLLKTMTRFVDKLNANVIKRSKINKDEFDKLVAYELWIDSEDSLDKGLIDSIVNLDVPYREELMNNNPPQQEEQHERSEHTPFELRAPESYNTLWKRLKNTSKQ